MLAGYTIFLVLYLPFSGEIVRLRQLFFFYKSSLVRAVPFSTDIIIHYNIVVVGYWFFDISCAADLYVIFVNKLFILLIFFKGSCLTLRNIYRYYVLHCGYKTITVSFCFIFTSLFFFIFTDYFIFTFHCFLLRLLSTSFYFL